MIKARRSTDLAAQIRALTDPSTIDPRETFGIVVDTREQRPWSFAGVPTVAKGLASGDYSVVGFEEDGIALERKSLDDLIGSMTWNAGRFGRELDRLRSFQLAAVIIEAGPDSIAFRRYHARKMEPAEVFDLIAQHHVRHAIPFMYAGTKKHAASMALRLVYRFWCARAGELQASATASLEATLLRGDA